MKKNFLPVSVLTIFFFFSFLSAQEKKLDEYSIDVEAISLEDLLKLEITSASKFSESVSKTPTPILVVTKEDIANRRYTSLIEVMNDLPGFDVIASHGDITQLTYARGNRTGSFNERTMFLVNGVEHNILYSQHMAIENDFPLSSIERIEVLYGPASAVYGPNAFSGIINIITKSAKNIQENSSKVYTQFGGGAFDTKLGEVTFLGNYNGTALSVSYRRFRSDRFDITGKPGFFSKSIIGNPEVWGPFAKFYPEYKNGTDDYSIMARLNYQDFEVGFSRFETRQGNGAVYPYDKTLPTEDWNFFKNIFYVKYDKTVSDKLSLNFYSNYHHDGVGPDAFWGQGWSGNDSGDETWGENRSVQMLTWKFISSKWTIQQDFIYKPAEKWIISGGIKYASGTYQKGYEQSAADLIVFKPGDINYNYSVLFPQPLTDGLTPGNIFRDSEWGGFLQAKYSCEESKINLVIGARYDDNDLYGDSFNPRIGATYQLFDNVLLKANYGTAFQAPAPRNLYAGWGGLAVSSNLKPDEISTVDFSIVHSNEILINDITFYYNKIKNSIMQGINLPQKNIYGFEYKMNYLIGHSAVFKNTRLQLYYSYTNAKYDKALINTSTGRTSDKIGDIADHKLSLIFDTDIYSNLHFNARVNYVGARETTISNPVKEVESFVVVNTSLQLNDLITNGLSFYFNVYNLLDQEYYHPGYDSANAGEDTSAPSKGWWSSRFPQPGRNIQVGINLEF